MCGLNFPRPFFFFFGVIRADISVISKGVVFLFSRECANFVVFDRIGRFRLKNSGREIGWNFTGTIRYFKSKSWFLFTLHLKFDHFFIDFYLMITSFSLRRSDR